VEDIVCQVMSFTMVKDMKIIPSCLLKDCLKLFFKRVC